MHVRDLTVNHSFGHMFNYFIYYYHFFFFYLTNQNVIIGSSGENNKPSLWCHMQDLFAPASLPLSVSTFEFDAHISKSNEQPSPHPTSPRSVGTSVSLRL